MSTRQECKALWMSFCLGIGHLWLKLFQIIVLKPIVFPVKFLSKALLKIIYVDRILAAAKGPIPLKRLMSICHSSLSFVGYLIFSAVTFSRKFWMKKNYGLGWSDLVTTRRWHIFLVCFYFPKMSYIKIFRQYVWILKTNIKHMEKNLANKRWLKNNLGNETVNSWSRYKVHEKGWGGWFEVAKSKVHSKCLSYPWEGSILVFCRWGWLEVVKSEVHKKSDFKGGWGGRYLMWNWWFSATLPPFTRYFASQVVSFAEAKNISVEI